jgi:hypothetical protein
MLSKMVTDYVKNGRDLVAALRARRQVVADKMQNLLRHSRHDEQAGTMRKQDGSSSRSRGAGAGTLLPSHPLCDGFAHQEDTLRSSMPWLAFVPSLVSALGCGGRTIADPAGASSEGFGPTCVPGRQVECACFDGTIGAQVCSLEATFGPCSCHGAGSGGPGSSGSGLSSGSSGAGSGEVGQETALSAGSSVLIDVFTADSGIFIILSDEVLLVDRLGQTLQTIPYPREITAAAFDGGTLVVADKAKLTSFDLALRQIISVDLMETCASAALVGRGRFVCGPANDWDRVFYTYDAMTGALLASSNMYTYNGIPMRRIPGKEDFVTVSDDSSPSDFYLYSVDASGEAAYVGESPYHGDFRVTRVYAFDGSPPAHLITDEGLMLHIYGKNCTSAAGPFDSECFTKDGSLGTLSGSQLFIGMDSDGAGKLYGLVDPTPDPFSDESLCNSGCLVQRIDVASRTIETQSVHHLDLGAVVTLRHDAVSGAMVLGYRLPGDYYFPDDPYPGYKVVLAKYE